MRDDKVTIAKGIGILLMVAAHAGIPDAISRFIAMFHMPLFFFMSGYCFKEKYLSPSPITFINKRIKGLYIPFVKYQLLFLLFHNVFFHLNIYNDEYGFNGEVSHLYTLRDYAIKCVRIVIGFHDGEQLLGGYWFLPQLFYASVIGFFAIKYVKNIYVSVTIAFLATIVTAYLHLSIPFWRIGSLTLLATTFFLLGYMYKQKMDNWHQCHLALLFAVVVAIGSIYWPTTMLSYDAQEVPLYVVTAFYGTLMILTLSQWLTQRENKLKRLLIYIGDNTITILTWHFLCFKLVSLAIIGIYDLLIVQLACFPVIPEYRDWWPVYLLAGAGMPLVMLRLSQVLFKRNIINFM